MGHVAAAARIPKGVLGVLLGLLAPPGDTVAPTIAARVGNDHMRRRQLMAAGFAIPLGLLTGLDDALALLPTPASAGGAGEITDRLARARRWFDTGDLTRLIGELPDLIATADQEPTTAASRPPVRGWRAAMTWPPKP